MRRVAIALLALALLLLSGFASEVAKTLWTFTSEAPSTAQTSEAPQTVSTSNAPQTSTAPQTIDTLEASAPVTTFPFEEDAITYVEYKSGTLMEIVPTHTTAPAPCVVILHGHGVETTFYDGLARAVAVRDAVVFMPDWNDTLPSAKDPRTTTITEGLDDIADAIRFIRLHASRYGGDPERIVLVGHSLGAAVGLTIMFAGDRFGTQTFPHEVSVLPDAYVSLDGVVPFRELLWNETLRGLYDRDPGTWDKINPDTYMGEAGPRKGVEFRFFVATLDFSATQSMAERMRRLGYKTSVQRIKVDHMEAGRPLPQTVEAIAELAHPD